MGYINSGHFFSLFLLLFRSCVLLSFFLFCVQILFFTFRWCCVSIAVSMRDSRYRFLCARLHNRSPNYPSRVNNLFRSMAKHLQHHRVAWVWRVRCSLHSNQIMQESIKLIVYRISILYMLCVFSAKSFSSLPRHTFFIFLLLLLLYFFLYLLYLTLLARTSHTKNQVCCWRCSNDRRVSYLDTEPNRISFPKVGGQDENGRKGSESTWSWSCFLGNSPLNGHHKKNE